MIWLNSINFCFFSSSYISYRFKSFQTNCKFFWASDAPSNFVPTAHNPKKRRRRRKRKRGSNTHEILHKNSWKMTNGSNLYFLQKLWYIFKEILHFFTFITFVSLPKCFKYLLLNQKTDLLIQSIAQVMRSTSLIRHHQQSIWDTDDFLYRLSWEG